MITFYIDSSNIIRMKSQEVPDFYGMIKLCRKFYLKFEPSTKTYIIPLNKFEIVYEALSEIDEIEGYQKVLTFYKQKMIPQSEIVFVRREFNNSLLRVPPIKGKPPNEDFQIIDSQRMMNRNRYGLFLQMGLGKTWCVITTLNHIWADEGNIKVLIITTGSGVYTFYKELEKFAVGLRMDRVAIGDKNNREPFDPDIDVVICSYRSFLLISDHYYKKNNNKDYVSKNYRKPCILFQDWIGNNKAILILDESHCFPYNTLVYTDIGELKIGDIVENRLNVKVLSYNHELNKFEYKQINNYFKRKTNKLLQIHTTNNKKVISTYTHPFYTTNGYKEIEKIKNDESLFSLQKRISNIHRKKEILQSSLLSRKSKKKRKKKMFDLWKRIFCKTFKNKNILFSQLRNEKNISKRNKNNYLSNLWKRIESSQMLKTKILFKKLFRKMDDESTRNKRKNFYKTTTFKNAGILKNIEGIKSRKIQENKRKLIQKNEKKQSYVQSKYIRKNEKFNERKNIFIQRGEFENNKTSNIISKKIKFRKKYGVCYFNKRSKRKISKFTKLLQSGYCYPRNKISNRNRRGNSQIKKMEVFGQKEGRDIKGFRLESNKILERRSIGQYKRSDKEDTIVYNLEVEDNNNYFANDFLVHNCVASMQARQTKVIHLHSKYFYYRYLLSGTPADKPEKWYSQLKILDPALVKGKDYWTWLDEYANIGTRFSQYGISSFKSEKLQELNNSILQISSRRLIDDCLELPEQFIKKVYIPLSGEHRDIYEGFVEYYIDTMMKSGDGSIKLKNALMEFQHMILSVDNPELLKKHYILDDSLVKKINNFSFQKSHSKIDILLQLLLEHEEEQIVVWTSHPSVSDSLETILIANKISVGKIHGECIPKGMDSNQFKQIVIDEFKSGKFRVLLSASQMLSTSITMTNSCIQIFFDRTFNYVEFAQDRCRIYRIGQTRPVYSYILIADKTLDITRDKRLENKNFFDKEFLSNNYMDKAMARRLFNPE